MSTWPARTVALALLAAATFQAWADNAIQSITSSQQAGAEVVRIELSEPLATAPTGFSIQTPPRIALDLPGVSNAMGRNSVEINQGNLRSANVAVAGERTRLVLNLKAPSSYRTQLQGNALLVVLESVAPAPVAAGTSAGTGEATVRFAESLNRTQLPLKDIDFRRGQDGTGRVIVDLAEQPGRGRHQAAGADPGGRVPAFEPAGKPAPSPRRDRLRHAGVHCLDVPER